MLPPKWSRSHSNPGTEIADPNFGVYVVYMYIHTTRYVLLRVHQLVSQSISKSVF